MNNNEFISKFQNTIGVVDYNIFLYSLNEAKQQGKFRFWQEVMLKKFADGTNYLLPESFSEIMKLFVGAELAEEKVTKEAFLANPVKCYYNPNAKLEDSWIKDAWKIPKFCDDLSYCLARSVSKTGNFNLGIGTANTLSRILDLNEIVELYNYIKMESERLENEWLPEFIKLFPKSEGHL